MTARVAVGIWIALTLLSGHAYVQVWHSDLTLWRHARQVTPTNQRAIFNYAVALAKDGTLGQPVSILNIQ